jgi:hypothetical protein
MDDRVHRPEMGPGPARPTIVPIHSGFRITGGAFIATEITRGLTEQAIGRSSTMAGWCTRSKFQVLEWLSSPWVVRSLTFGRCLPMLNAGDS